MKQIKEIILPKDNGSHDYTIEWWYFNGHLLGDDQREYSFMDCFFKVNVNKVNIPHILPHLVEDHFKNGEYIHFAHSVISDIKKKKNYKEIQNISLVSKDSFQKELLFINYKNGNFLEDTLNSEIIETAPNNFLLKTKHLNLNLISKKNPLLEGGHGYVGTPESGSYYYSFTDMTVEGEIIMEEKKIKVKGKAWMDHQWADAVYKKDKWTWFSFQLENGIEIMCVEYATKDGIDILINMIDKEGNQSQYKKAEIKFRENIWESKKTKAKYPLVWNIKIKEAEIEIETRALIKDQEMIFGPINYWEGPTEVSAKIKNNKVKGKGFMELVGYPADYNYLLLAGEEIEENIISKIKKIFRKR